MVVQLLFRGVLHPGFVQLTRSVLVQFPSGFFSKHFVSVHVVHP